MIFFFPWAKLFLFPTRIFRLQKKRRGSGLCRFGNRLWRSTPRSGQSGQSGPQTGPHRLLRGRFPRHLEGPSTRPRPLARPIGKSRCLFGTDLSESRQVQIRVPFCEAPKRTRVMARRNHAFFRAGEGRRSTHNGAYCPGPGRYNPCSGSYSF